MSFEDKQTKASEACNPVNRAKERLDPSIQQLVIYGAFIVPQTPGWKHRVHKTDNVPASKSQ